MRARWTTRLTGRQNARQRSGRVRGTARDGWRGAAQARTWVSLQYVLHSPADVLCASSRQGRQSSRLKTKPGEQMPTSADKARRTPGVLKTGTSWGSGRRSAAGAELASTLGFLAARAGWGLRAAVAGIVLARVREMTCAAAWLLQSLLPSAAGTRGKIRSQLSEGARKTPCELGRSASPCAGMGAACCVLCRLTKSDLPLALLCYAAIRPANSYTQLSCSALKL